MLVTIRAPTPRIGSPAGSAAAAVDAAAGVAAAGTVGAAAEPAPQGSWSGRRSRRRGRWGRWCRPPRGLVVGEELAPAVRHRSGIAQVLLVHLLDQPCVGSEGFRGVLVGHERQMLPPDGRHASSHRPGVSRRDAARFGEA